jgi:polysaccharide export outer membrane protein
VLGRTLGVTVRLAALMISVSALNVDAPPALELHAAEYVIGAGDVLAITIWDQLDMSGKFTVSTDGSFTFPLVGKLQVGGHTAQEVEAELKRRLRQGIFVDPQVTVVVETYVSQRVFLVGEVRTPGSYALRGETTLLEALAQAGSPTAEAASEVLIVRSTSGTPRTGPLMPPEANDAQVLRVDLAALQQGKLSQNVLLHNGDTIFVPKAEAIFVFGQVRGPGQYVVRRETTVMQALSLAGGLTDRSALNRIRIVRMVNGEKKEIRVKLTDLVQPGDTLVVPERFF